MADDEEQGRALKRPRSSLESEEVASLSSSPRVTSNEELDAVMEGTVEIVPDGDVLLKLSSIAGVKKGVNLSVSSDVLRLASPVLRAELDRMPDVSGELVFEISVPSDDGDAMLLLCTLVHLQNHKLPARIPSELLHKLANLANKYQCVSAASRATVSWFDRIFHSKTMADTFKMIETAYLLDEPLYFSRFTERWIRTEPVVNKFVTRNTDPAIRKLALELQNRRQSLFAAVRAEIDLLVDPCSAAFSKSREHYIDYAPGMKPDADEGGRVTGSLCRVDEMAGTTFLGALRDAHIWPATTWPPTLGALLNAIKDFRIPEYDDCDKCEFCEGVKEAFERNLAVVRTMHADRLWGLCLDCFKAGGVNQGECRIEHAKAKGSSG